MKIYKLAIILLAFVIAACNNSSNIEIEDLPIEEDQEIDRSDDLAIYTIPTPVLISNILKLYEIEYDNEILESNTSIDHEQFSSLAMALNLGVNLVDLSYSSVFEQTQYSIRLLNHIDKIMSSMNIRNYETIFAIERFRENISDPDSISYMLVEFQENLNGYYTTEKSDDISLFIIGGIYIEGLYISLHYHDDVIGDKFRKNMTQAAGYKNLILQQKAYLENIDELLSDYKKEENHELIDYYQKLIAQFEQLELSYNTNEKSNKIEDINYNRSELENLKSLTNEIREYILKM